MFKTFFALARGAAAAAEEELTDRSALLILDQQIRDAASAVERGNGPWGSPSPMTKPRESGLSRHLRASPTLRNAPLRHSPAAARTWPRRQPKA